MEIEEEMRNNALYFQTKQRARNFMLDTTPVKLLDNFSKEFKTMRSVVLPLLRPSKPYGIINSNKE